MLDRAWTAALAAALLLANGAWSQSLHAELERAEAMLRAGEAAQALELYRALQVDHPDAAAVLFGVGAAHYAQAERQAAQGDPTRALAAYGEAQGAFERLLGAEDAVVRAHAAFNRANAVARARILEAADGDYRAQVGAYRAAVATYESVLHEYPDHEYARRNLDHVRYKLKLLLQDPPDDEPPPPDASDDTPPPALFSLFMEAVTELPGAVAVPDENVVRIEPKDPAS